jgi:DnaJ family protein C protein 7
MLSKYKNALEDAEKSVKIDKSFQKGYICIVKCSIVLGDCSRAEQAMKKYRDLDPQNINLKAQQKSINKLRELIDKATSNFNSQQYQISLGYYEDLLSIALASELFMLQKAECLIYLERYKEAEDIVRKIILSNPTNENVFYVLGFMYYCKGNLDSGVEYFDKISAQSSVYSKTRRFNQKALALKQMKESAENLLKNGKLKEACDLYTEALEIDPANKKINSIIHFKRAEIFTKLRNIENCVNDCTTAIKFDKNNIDALDLRARSHYELGNFTKCIEDCELVLEARKSDIIQEVLRNAISKREKELELLAESKKSIGNDLYHSKKYDEALKAYTEAINICPNISSFYCNRCACYMMLLKYQNPLEKLKRWSK